VPGFLPGIAARSGAHTLDGWPANPEACGRTDLGRANGRGL